MRDNNFTWPKFHNTEIHNLTTPISGSRDKQIRQRLKSHKIDAEHFVVFVLLSRVNCVLELASEEEEEEMLGGLIVFVNRQGENNKEKLCVNNELTIVKGMWKVCVRVRTVKSIQNTYFQDTNFVGILLKTSHKSESEMETEI